MTTRSISTRRIPSLRRLKESFVSEVLPRVETHGRVFFRHVRCASTKEECLAEMTALCWKWYVRLVKKGKRPSRFVSALATFAARAVKSGRRVCGQEKANDVLSPVAQKHKDFCVGTLPDFNTLSSNPMTDALLDNTQTPPDEQACFRLDFPAWLASLHQRNRALALAMALGHRTRDLASGFSVSSARVSQIRRELHEDWTRFCGEDRP